MMRWTRVFVGILTLVAVGCNSKSGQLPTFKAKGLVQIDGKPFGPCTLTLEPEPVTTTSRSAVGEVGADGKFTSLRTYAPGDGIPAGDYNVKVVADAMKGTPVPGYRPKTVTVSKPDSGVVEMVIDLVASGGPSNDLPGSELTTPTDSAPFAR